MKEPIIAIMAGDSPGTYEVYIRGERIKRLRSFSLRISMEKNPGNHEVPFCSIEQYLPFEGDDDFGDDFGAKVED